MVFKLEDTLLHCINCGHLWVQTIEQVLGCPLEVVKCPRCRTVKMNDAEEINEGATMPGPNKGDTFTCAGCKRELIADNDNTQAVAENEMIYGEEYDETVCEIICDDCFKEFMVWFEKNRLQ